MTRQYLRTVEVVAGVPGQPGRRWTDLKMNGSVEKTDSKKPNVGTVQVYNLTQDSVGFLRQPGAVLKVAVGYGGETSVIFTGDVDEVTFKRDGANTVTEVKARDGQLAFQGASLSQTFDGPVTNTTLIRRLADAIGLPLLEIPALEERVYQYGYTAVGPVRNALDEVCASSDARWSIQDGQLVITRNGQPTSEAAALLARETGLVGQPEATKHGVKFTALLNPLVTPRRFVKLESRDFTGFYLVKKVTHRFDTDEQEFYSEAEAVSPETL